MKTKEKKHGIIAGISLIIMAIAAGFAYGYAHNEIVADSPEITLNNLITNTSLFYAELSGWAIIFITDLVVAISLYFFFCKTSRPISVLTALIRIVYTLVLGIAIIQLFRIVPLLSGGQTDALELASQFQRFENLWSMGLIIFGLHLIGLGYLSVKSSSVPTWLGYLLYFGGASYTLLHGARHLDIFDAQLLISVEKILALPMGLAEILLAFFLIYHGFQKSSAK